MVPSDMDIVDQTMIFTKLDPFHQQFIPTPSVNAGEILIYVVNVQIKLVRLFRIVAFIK